MLSIKKQLINQSSAGSRVGMKQRWIFFFTWRRPIPPSVLCQRNDCIPWLSWTPTPVRLHGRVLPCPHLPRPAGLPFLPRALRVLLYGLQWARTALASLLSGLFPKLARKAPGSPARVLQRHRLLGSVWKSAQFGRSVIITIDLGGHQRNIHEQCHTFSRNGIRFVPCYTASLGGCGESADGKTVGCGDRGGQSWPGAGRKISTSRVYCTL